MLTIRVACITLCVLGAFSPWARADLVPLDLSQCCGNGQFGNVTIEQGANSKTVDITLTLAPGEIFANTGAGDALGFNLTNPFSLVPGSLTTGFKLNGPDTFSYAGSFLESIVCTVCGHGTSAPQITGPLSFSLVSNTDLAPGDFLSNDQGFFFASDIGVPSASGGLNSGVVAGNDPMTPVPEPGSILLLMTASAAILLQVRRLRTLRRHRNDC